MGTGPLWRKGVLNLKVNLLSKMYPLMYFPNLTDGLWVRWKGNHGYKMPKMIFICKVAGITFRDRVERTDMWGELKVEMLFLALKGLCRGFIISASLWVFSSRPTDTAGDLVVDISSVLHFGNDPKERRSGKGHLVYHRYFYNSERHCPV